VYVFPLLYGFLLADDRSLEASVRRHRRVALGLGVAGYIAMMAWAVMLDNAGIDPFSGGGAAIGWRALKGFTGWWWVVAILGFAGTVMEARRARMRPATAAAPGDASYRGTRLYRVGRYANAAVLPFYVLHLPVIVAIAYVAVQWDIGIIAKYVATAVASFVATLAVYEFAVRRTRLTRFLFGMKPPRDQGWNSGVSRERCVIERRPALRGSAGRIGRRARPGEDRHPARIPSTARRAGLARTRSNPGG
jgi:hypothetical protein